MNMDPSLNVFGDALQTCSTDPMTGFFRNGACDTCAADNGSHTVCAILTAEFLAYSKYVGNDLSTPRPEFGFPMAGACAHRGFFRPMTKAVRRG